VGRTVLVLGDQLDRRTGALRDAEPGRDRIVMIESFSKLRERPWHRHKLTYVLSAMRHFAGELRDAGFDVTYRAADSIRAGLEGFDPDDIVVMAPSHWGMRQTLAAWGVEQVANDAYIAGEEAFRRWADGRRSLLLEDFYRDVRREHGWLMDGAEPLGGRWNLDQENRERPPKGGVDPPAPWRPREDDLDAATRADVDRYARDLGLELYGEERPRLFPVTRKEALASLRSFLDRRLDGFGPLEDAVAAAEPFLWHSLLSAPLNLGLLHPAEVCDAVDAHHRAQGGPLNSHEGFLRQVCGWREYVWGLYWYRMPRWREENALGQAGAVPSFYWDGDTDLRCLSSTLGDLRERAWTHHIPRLMVLGNFALLAGVNPQELANWFHSMYIDGYDWVMVPNVVGMSQWGDGGVMATKPYAASANYINRMTDYCGPCRYNPRTRTDEDSCPFNVLYWDFVARNRPRFEHHPRMARVVRLYDRFDVEEQRAIRARATRFRAGEAGAGGR
jgi:deoxyribodipyrimidine photolyase-related protein